MLHARAPEDGKNSYYFFCACLVNPKITLISTGKATKWFRRKYFIDSLYLYSDFLKPQDFTRLTQETGINVAYGTLKSGYCPSILVEISVICG